jgi:hypothetical protein
MTTEYERFAPVERLIEVRGEPYRFWCPPDIDALIDEEAFAADERIPYWANVWESAIVLAEDLALLEPAGRSLRLPSHGHRLRGGCPGGGAVQRRPECRR